jgi:hypothetical protein
MRGFIVRSLFTKFCDNDKIKENYVIFSFTIVWQDKNTYEISAEKKVSTIESRIKEEVKIAIK